MGAVQTIFQCLYYRPTEITNVSDNASDSSSDLTLRDSLNEEDLDLNPSDRGNVGYQQHQHHNELDQSNAILQNDTDNVTCNSNNRDTCLIESLNSNTEAFPDGKKTQNASNVSPTSTSTCTSRPSSDYVVSSEEGLKTTSDDKLMSLGIIPKKIALARRSGPFSFFQPEPISSSSLHKLLAQNMHQQDSLSTQTLNNINETQLNLKSNLDSFSGPSENPSEKLASLDRCSKEAKLLRSLRPNEPKAKNSTRSKHTYRFSIIF